VKCKHKHKKDCGWKNAIHITDTKKWVKKHYKSDKTIAKYLRDNHIKWKKECGLMNEMS